MGEKKGKRKTKQTNKQPKPTTIIKATVCYELTTQFCEFYNAVPVNKKQLNVALSAMVVLTSHKLDRIILELFSSLGYSVIL